MLPVQQPSEHQMIPFRKMAGLLFCNSWAAFKNWSGSGGRGAPWTPRTIQALRVESWRRRLLGQSSAQL